MATPRKLFPVVGIHLRSLPNAAVVRDPHAERDPHARGGTARATESGIENGIEKSTGTEIATGTKTGTETEIEAGRVIVTARETGTSEEIATEAVRGNEKMRRKRRRQKRKSSLELAMQRHCVARKIASCDMAFSYTRNSSRFGGGLFCGGTYR